MTSKQIKKIPYEVMCGCPVCQYVLATRKLSPKQKLRLPV